MDAAMKKLHPRLGLLEVIDESSLFYRVSTTYDFWIPKVDFVSDAKMGKREIKLDKQE